jgi:cytoskeletal protein RodZ
MKLDIKKLEKPASIIGPFVLILIGIWIATSTQVSITKQNDSTKEKVISTPVRVTIGVIILLTGLIIFYPFLKNKQE